MNDQSNQDPSSDPPVQVKQEKEDPKPISIKRESFRCGVCGEYFFYEKFFLEHIQLLHHSKPDCLISDDYREHVVEELSDVAVHKSFETDPVAQFAQINQTDKPSYSIANTIGQVKEDPEPISIKHESFRCGVCGEYFFCEEFFLEHMQLLHHSKPDCLIKDDREDVVEKLSDVEVHKSIETDPVAQFSQINQTNKPSYSIANATGHCIEVCDVNQTPPVILPIAHEVNGGYHAKFRVKFQSKRRRNERAISSQDIAVAVELKCDETAHSLRSEPDVIDRADETDAVTALEMDVGDCEDNLSEVPSPIINLSSCSTSEETSEESNAEQPNRNLVVYEKQFKCKHCNYSSCRRSNLEKHNNELHQDEIYARLPGHQSAAATRPRPQLMYSCSQCEYSSNKRQHLQYHVIMNHINRIDDRKHIGDTNKVATVTKRYNNGKEAEQDYVANTGSSSSSPHNKLKSTKKVHSCLKCDFKCDSKCNLKNHNKDFHLYRCEYCYYASDSKSRFLRHQAAYTINAPYTCSYCDYHCSHKCQLKIHCREHIGDTNKVTKITKRYSNGKEAEQDYVANTGSSSSSPHNKLKSTKKVHSCLKCDFKCDSNCKCKLKNHKKDFHISYTQTNHHIIGLFKCEYCLFSTKYKSSLTKHTRKYEECKYSCSKCDYKCKDEETLQNHAVEHTSSDYRFTCSQCNRQFKRKDTFNYHVIAHHTVEKPFKCDHCSFATKFKASLKEHHTNMHIRTNMNTDQNMHQK